MVDESLRDAEAPAPVSASRGRVLAVLQERGPVGVEELAERLGLHANTARFHLDALVGAGLASRAREPREVPGRPRMLYTARDEAAQEGQRSYRLLAEILTSFVAAEEPRPSEAGLTAGRVWGHYLADRPAPFERLDAEETTRRSVSTLADIGFAPEQVTEEGERRVLLHHCPFLEVAEKHPDVVCSIHLGLMQGLLSELGGPVRVERLDPFVEPSLCVAHLVEDS